jgi:hypothetical protein
MSKESYLPVDVRLASRAGWLLKQNGIRVRVVPSPPDVDPECGFSLVLPCENLESAIGLLREARIMHKKPVIRGA